MATEQLTFTLACHQLGGSPVGKMGSTGRKRGRVPPKEPVNATVHLLWPLTYRAHLAFCQPSNFPRVWRSPSPASTQPLLSQLCLPEGEVLRPCHCLPMAYFRRDAPTPRTPGQLPSCSPVLTVPTPLCFALAHLCAQCFHTGLDFRGQGTHMGWHPGRGVGSLFQAEDLGGLKKMVFA